MAKYPTRARIIDAEGKHWHGLPIRNPDEAMRHIGKEGLAERVGDNVRITLDDGSILWGYECWWEPAVEEAKR